MLGLPFSHIRDYPPNQTCALSPLYRRIGCKASILIQLLLFAITGLATAFMPTSEMQTDPCIPSGHSDRSWKSLTWAPFGHKQHAKLTYCL